MAVRKKGKEGREGKPHGGGRDEERDKERGKDVEGIKERERRDTEGRERVMRAFEGMEGGREGKALCIT